MKRAALLPLSFYTQSNNMLTITPEALVKIGPSIKKDRAAQIASALTEVCNIPAYGINTPDIFHEFIANMMEECMEFSRFEENLNYKTPKRLMAVWPGRFPTVDIAIQFVNNPKKLAEFVYGKRERDLGNVTAEDGWDFRGSGPIQMTGRRNITFFTLFYNRSFKTEITIKEMAELLRTDIKIGIHSACWFFAISKGLIQLAIDDNMTKIIKRINGGLTNSESRFKYYQRAKQAIPE